MAGIAKSGKRAFVATIICSPTDSTSISAASVVDLLMSSSASIAERKRADIAVAETGLLALEEKLSFGGRDIAAISELMPEATRSTLDSRRVVATSGDAGIVDSVAIVARMMTGITLPVINDK